MTERRLVPAPERNELRATVQALLDVSRDDMTKLLATPEMVQLTFDAIKSRLTIGSRCDHCGQEGRAPRDGPRLMLEAYGAVKTAPQIENAMAVFFGVAPDVAKMRSEMVAELDEMDEQTRFDLCLDFVVAHAEENATMRSQLTNRVAAAMQLLPAGE